MSIAGRDGLIPVTDYAKAAGIDGKEYFPQFWDAWWWNDKLWGMMITCNSSVVAYQPALFEEVGADPANPPKSTTELDAVAQKLEKIDAAGNIERVGLLPGGLTWWGRVFGGSFYDAANSKITANDPKVVAALDWENSYRQRLGQEKVAAFQSGYGDYMSTQNAFFVGKEAMTQVGEWFIQFQKKYAPDLVMEFMPAPYPEGGNDNTTVFDGSVFTIPKGVKNPDASWEFIVGSASRRSWATSASTSKMCRPSWRRPARSASSATRASNWRSTCSTARTRSARTRCPSTVSCSHAWPRRRAPCSTVR